MIKKVLIWFAIATIAILFIAWLLTGGIGKIADVARGITTPLSADFWRGLSPTQLRLPWQPEDLTLGPEFTGDFGESSSASTEPLSTQDELDAAQKEYEDVLKKMQEQKTFGDPSPHRGKVRLSAGAAGEGLSSEHVVVEASGNNSAPIKVSGWSLQSALTGVRGYIPRGTQLFTLGAVNAQEDIYLNQGAFAVIASGLSPVGTSFRENKCTGYLNGLHAFAPALPRNCPAPSEELPLTPQNIQTYGDACYDFVQTIPSCTIVRSVPPGVSPSCHLFLSNNLSYNGCVQANRHEREFLDNSWRVYLNSGGELWRNTHDIIRLLDSNGLTVDVIYY
jgi:hypothetical protein